MEANGHHGHPIQYNYDQIKQTLMAETDRPIALREALVSCRNAVMDFAFFAKASMLTLH